MSPEQLASRLIDLTSAAELVEAIDDGERRRERGWDLDGWHYELVPWGVRFTYQPGPQEARFAVVAVMACESGPALEMIAREPALIVRLE